jgi:hypothetical protein
MLANSKKNGPKKLDVLSTLVHIYSVEEWHLTITLDDECLSLGVILMKSQLHNHCRVTFKLLL